MVAYTLYAWMIRFMMFLVFTLFISNISICNTVCKSIIKGLQTIYTVKRSHIIHKCVEIKVI